MSRWNLIDLEFEIQHEREERERNVKGEEFDVITQELMQRIETLEDDVKRIDQELQTLKTWKD